MNAPVAIPQGMWYRKEGDQIVVGAYNRSQETIYNLLAVLVLVAMVYVAMYLFTITSESPSSIRW